MEGTQYKNTGEYGKVIQIVILLQSCRMSNYSKLIHDEYIIVLFVHYPGGFLLVILCITAFLPVFGSFTSIGNDKSLHLMNVHMLCGYDGCLCVTYICVVTQTSSLKYTFSIETRL